MWLNTAVVADVLPSHVLIYGMGYALIFLTRLQMTYDDAPGQTAQVVQSQIMRELITVPLFLGLQFHPTPVQTLRRLLACFKQWAVTIAI